MIKRENVLLKSFILALLLHGCNLSEDSSATSQNQRVLESAISITTEEKDAIMASHPLALKEAGYAVAEIIKFHIDQINKEDRLNFSQELSYCDISGERVSLSNEEVDLIKTEILYHECKDENQTQDGSIEIFYTSTEQESNYPTTLTLQVKENYLFNDILLKRNFETKATLLYSQDMSPRTISLELNGLVNFDYQTLNFKAYKEVY